MTVQSLKQLENAIIVQADSLGLEVGSGDFDIFCKKRILEPDNDLMNFATENGKNTYKGNIRDAIWLPHMEERYLYFKYLKTLVQWARRNKGMTLSSATRALNLKSEWSDTGVNEKDTQLEMIKRLAKHAEEFGFPNILDWLDGSDDVLFSAPTDGMNSGCRGSIGINQYA
jgi:hypothetical protein